MMLLALIALPLAACGPSDQASPGKLPYPPADIQSCFRSASGVPDRALTQGDVEALWKEDRFRSAVNARCGSRLYSWYMSLMANWQ